MSELRKAAPSKFPHDDPAYSIQNADTQNNAVMIGAIGASRMQKTIVVFITLFLAFGANYMAAALPTLKPFILKNTYHHGQLIDNSKYGVMTSASTLINTILPLFSGVLIDIFGPSIIAVVCSTCIVMGNLILLLGASKGHFSMINGGEILLGIGNITIHMCQLKLYAHWFRGSAVNGPGWVSFVTGLDIAVGRVFGLIGTLVPVPIAESMKKWYGGFYLGLIFSALAWVLSIVYLVYERTLPSTMRFAKAIDTGPWKKMPLWKQIVVFCGAFWRNVISIPAAFWILILLQLLQTGTVAAYGNNAVDIMTVTRGKNNSASVKSSAFKYSMHYAIPMVLTPLAGYYFDLFGHRSAFVSASACFYVICFSLMGFTKIHAAVPMLFDAFGYTLNSVPFLATVPLLIRNQTLIGTAHGVLKAYNACGETIMQVAGGALQDVALSKGKPKSHKYDYMLYYLLAMKSVDCVIGLIYHVLDKRYFGSVMCMSEKQRVEKENELGCESQGVLCKPYFFWTTLGCVMFVLLVAVAYTIFIVYWITDPNSKPGQG